MTDQNTDVSITDLLNPCLLKTATALLLRTMRVGGKVTIKVENHRALFVISDAPAPEEKMDLSQAVTIWEVAALKLLTQELASVVQAGYGEVTFELGVKKCVSYYPEKRSPGD